MIIDKKSKNVVILFSDCNSLIGQQIKRRQDNTFEIYKGQALVNRIIRKFHFKTNIPYQQIWYGSWKKHISDNTTIILFDSIFNIKIINWIKRRWKNVRIIFWFWNPVKQDLYKDLIKESGIELWTFDPEDSIKYNLKFNTQFYFDTIKLQNEELQYDILFVGKDKGRYDQLNKLQELFNKNGLNTFFYIVSDTKINTKQGTYSHGMSYSLLLDYVAKSKAILDIVQEGQEGLTLRSMEALFFEKKLITNNQSIIKEKFYRKENIFIIGHDKIDEIEEFMNAAYIKNTEEVLKYYDFNAWINRFF